MKPGLKPSGPIRASFVIGWPPLCALRREVGGCAAGVPPTAVHRRRAGGKK